MPAPPELLHGQGFKGGAEIDEAALELDADEPCRAKVGEFLHRVNSNLILGSFILDPNDGEIFYKCYHSCLEDTLPEEFLVEMLKLPLMMFEMFSDSLLSVMFGFATPQEALEAFEKKMKK